MSDVLERIAALAPDKQALLAQRNPLSFAQQRLWFLDQFQPGQPVYTLAQAVRLDGALDLGALARSLATLADRHAGLRTVFPAFAGRPLQISAPAQRLPLTVADLSGLPEPARTAQTMQLGRSAAATAFDLARGPLWRVLVLRLAPAEHALVLAMHHIISDAWSMRIFVDELSALYAAERSGRPAALTDLPIQYLDFAIWERDWLQGDELAAQLDYWTRAIGDAPPVLALPADRPRPAAFGYRGAVQRFQVDAAPVEALKRLSRGADATLFMGLLAAFDALLARYSGQNRFVVGSPTANREREEVGGLIGFFVNMLALPADLSGDPTFRALLRRVRGAALGAYAHQDLPFEKLVDALQIPRDPGHTPLFQVALSLQNTPPPAPALGDLPMRPIALHNGTAKFDLMLDMAETPAGLSAMLEYNDEIFDATTIRRMAGHFAALLSGIAAAPDRPVADLPLLAPAERQQLLVEWNDTAGGWGLGAGTWGLGSEVRSQKSEVRSRDLGSSAGLLLHEQIAAQAARAPDAVAVAFHPAGADSSLVTRRSSLGSELSSFVLRPSSPVHLSYAALDARANQLARHLRALGVGPEARVAVDLDRSLDLPIALLAVLKAGGAFVPLDPAYPAARRQFMIEDSGATALITRGDKRRTTNDEGAGLSSVLRPSSNGRPRVVDLAHDWPAIAAQPAEAPDLTARADQLAYVIYTSGSTGTPKGVAVPLRGMLNLIAWHRRAYALGPADRVPLVAGLSFDVVVWELWPPLAAGACLVLPDEATRTTPALLARWLADQAITIGFVPTPLAEALLAIDPALPKMRALLTGGDRLRRYANPAQTFQLINHYGPTEASVVISAATIGASATDGRLPPIGRPLANARIHVLDRRGRPAPIGVAGELHLGGVGLARGYLGRPDLTAARFIPNPFAHGSGVRGQGSDPDPRSPNPDPRLYRTGDLARYLPDGAIEFLGRIDQQVKLRGYRIELGEIEATLAAHPAVREVAAALRDERLVAYVVPRNEDRGLKIEDSGAVAAAALSATRYLLPSELREWLRARLPDSMIPAAFVELAALPITPNGKIDRAALPAPDAAAHEAYVAPRTPEEELIAGVWAAVLGRERVGIDDNFFALGGHSLLATQLVSRLASVFARPLPVRALFDAPTVAGLAAYLAAARRNESPDALPPPLRPSAADGPQPLSFAQERMWLLDQFAPGNPAYNLPSALRLSGRLNVGALERSWRAIVRRHAGLRTRFTTLDGDPAQIVDPAAGGRWARADLRALPPDRREAEAQRLVGAEIVRPFDLSAGPLWRALLLQLDENEHIIALTVHHIVADGWSMGILVRELTTLYAAFAQGRPAALPDPQIRYVDFAVWQRAWLQGSARERQLSYWRNQLGGLAPLELPADRPRPPMQTYRGATETLTLAPALSGALTALSRAEGVTLFMTLLAAFQTLLYRYTGQPDIAVGTPIAGRNHAEIENLVGFFINTLVLRANLHDASGPLSFRALLRRVRETTLDAYAHQDIPFEQLLEALQPERDLSRTPLFQVFFNMLNFPMAAVDLLDLRVSAAALPEIGAKFDLTLQAQEQPDGLHLTAIYNTDLFDAARIRELLAQYQQLLQQAVADPERSIAAYSLVTPGARSALPDPFEPLGDDWVGAPHQLFARQARRAPDRLAAIDKDERWTYAELDRRANQLAQHLIAQGVRPQEVVAIYAHRSAALVWALIGALKAGAAFVVIDPAFPAARIIDYLAAAQPRALIQIAAAGPFASEVAARLAEFDLRARIVLPRRAEADAQGLFADQPADDPALPVGRDDLACIAFTSGSTGTPKGILGRHGPLTHFIPWVCRTFELGEDDRFSVLAGIAFDMLQREIFTALYLGAAVCLPDPERMGAPGWLAEWMREQGVSVAHLTPATGQLVTEGATTRIPALRRAFFIGEALTRWSVARLRRLAPDVLCINLYGLTEAQRAVSYFVIPSDDGAARETIPVGRGMPNLQLLILNGAGQLAGVGEVGEIYFRTPHLARGYLADEALTRERFLVNPFTQRPEDRMYKTGDLGRYLPDGNVESLGRADLQVKLRGYRIELGEIETALNTHPAVRESAVAARRLPRPPDAANQPEETLLVAYVVTSDELRVASSPDATNDEGSDSSFVLRPSSLFGELRDFLRARLPDYMIPSAFVALDALPRNAHGKVDRLALPLPDDLRPQLGVELVAPRDELEADLAAIWADVLGLAPRNGRPALGVHDNFFQLGGHSLLATRVISRIRERMQVELPLQALFENPTVAGLAQALARRRAEAESAPIGEIERIRQDSADQLLATLDQLSEEGVDALIEALLAERNLEP